MAGRGGYQPPAHPAPISGPGALSQRTDTGVSDSKAMVRPIGGGSYGDGKDFAAIQSGAPMAAAAGPGDATPVSPEAAGLVPFGADTQAPDQPVTSGADAGPGPGSSVLGGPSLDMVGADAQTMAQYIPVWEKIVNLPGSTPSARAALLRLKARLG